TINDQRRAARYCAGDADANQSTLPGHADTRAGCGSRDRAGAERRHVLGFRAEHQPALELCQSARRSGDRDVLSDSANEITPAMPHTKRITPHEHRSTVRELLVKAVH